MVLSSLISYTNWPSFGVRSEDLCLEGRRVKWIKSKLGMGGAVLREGVVRTKEVPKTIFLGIASFVGLPLSQDFLGAIRYVSWD